MIARGLLALGLALGAVGLAIIGHAPRAVGAHAQAQAARAKIKFSRHAEQRLRQRGVAREDVERLIAAGQHFDYRHAGKKKRGYYDARTGLFAATQGELVLTVIVGATPRYVEKLKRSGGP